MQLALCMGVMIEILKCDGTIPILNMSFIKCLKCCKISKWIILISLLDIPSLPTEQFDFGVAIHIIISLSVKDLKKKVY